MPKEDLHKINAQKQMQYQCDEMSYVQRLPTFPQQQQQFFQQPPIAYNQSTEGTMECDNQQKHLHNTRSMIRRKIMKINPNNTILLQRLRDMSEYQVKVLATDHNIFDKLLIDSNIKFFCFTFMAFELHLLKSISNNNMKSEEDIS